MTYSDQIVVKIETRIQYLTKEDDKQVREIIEEYENHHVLMAEKISEYLNVNYQCIFDLL